MRSFLGVRLQTRTLLSSNPPDSRLESSDKLTQFKLQEKSIELLLLGSYNSCERHRHILDRHTLVYVVIGVNTQNRNFQSK